LLDREGTVKVLDLGLARFFRDHTDLLTQQHDGNCILGTADYLSPEQSLDSHEVDIRTDIYSLGATFYFLLTGKPPFAEKVLAQKLLSQLVREPTPLRTLRPEVPEGLEALVAKMMTKDRDERYSIPREVVEALIPWTRTPIAPPTAEEIPQLCPAVLRVGVPKSSSTAPAKPAAHVRQPKQWQITAPRPALASQESPVASTTASATLSRSSDKSGSKVTAAAHLQPPSSKESRFPAKRPPTDTKNQIAGTDTIPNVSPRPSPDRLSPVASLVSISQASPRFKMLLIVLAFLGAAVFGLVLGRLFTPGPQVSITAPAAADSASRP
jgi:serine/threonine protein kinase